MSRFITPPRTRAMQFFSGPSVWLEFTPLAKMTGSVNLGQGAPGWSSPSFVQEALVEAVRTDSASQYARPGGAPALIEQIKSYYLPRVRPASANNIPFNANTQILVTVGASQAISVTCEALLNPGDEVVLIEPAFDIYTGAVHLNGAKPVYVPLRPRKDLKGPLSHSKQLTLYPEDLSSVLTDKTRMLILNSPHNPTGKIFSRDEYHMIAQLLEEKAPSCIVLSDEVYEHLVFEEEHIPFASVSESAYQRTLSVYSSGKTFSATGLKIGWLIGPESLVKDLQIAQQYVLFSCNHSSQIAIANSLKIAELPYENEPSYYEWICNTYKRKRDFLVDALKAADMEPIIPQGAFYILTKVPENSSFPNQLPEQIKKYVEEEGLEIDIGTANRPDYNFSRHLVLQKGVASIPTSAFYTPDHVGKSELSTSYIRFAFCHPDEVLEEAARRLQK